MTRRNRRQNQQSVKNVVQRKKSSVRKEPVEQKNIGFI